MVTSRPLVKEDLSPSRHTCDGAGLIEPSSATDPTIDGTGSTANPLVVTPSTDAGNVLGLGGDGKLFVATGAGGLSTIGAVNRTLTHDDGTGSTFVFNNGLAGVVGVGGVCAGIGAGQMIAAASINAATNNLELNSAAEHSSIADTDFAGDAAIATDISAVATYDVGPVANIVVNNPSTCRIMSYMLIITSNWGIEISGSGVLQLQIMEGAVVVKASQIDLSLAGSGNRKEDMERTVTVSGTIPAGGSVNRSFRGRIVVSVAFTAGSLWNDGSTALALLASTN